MKHFVWAALAVVLSVGALTPKSANSAVIINFVETGGDVIMDLSGSLDVSALGTPGTGSVFDAIAPSSSIVAVGISPAIFGDIYGGVGLTGPAFGTGGPGFADSASGDDFLLDGSADNILVPFGYVSGAPLSSTMTFLGQTFLSLGMTPGTYVYTYPADTITINVGPVSIPAPAGLPLALAGLGTVALVRQRRKKTADA